MARRVTLAAVAEGTGLEHTPLGEVLGTLEPAWGAGAAINE